MGWVCKYCSTLNEELEITCIVCDSPKPSPEEIAAAAAAATSDTAATRSRGVCTLTARRVAERRLGGDVVIPVGYNVIGEGAFENRTDITTVRIHAGVTKIMKNAFSGCKSLRSVICEGTLDSIGSKAFYNCPLILPASRPRASRIESDAFAMSIPTHPPARTTSTTPTPSASRPATTPPPGTRTHPVTAPTPSTPPRAPTYTPRRYRSLFFERLGEGLMFILKVLLVVLITAVPIVLSRAHTQLMIFHEDKYFMEDWAFWVIGTVGALFVVLITKISTKLVLKPFDFWLDKRNIFTSLIMIVAAASASATFWLHGDDLGLAVSIVVIAYLVKLVFALVDIGRERMWWLLAVDIICILPIALATVGAVVEFAA